MKVKKYVGNDENNLSEPPKGGRIPFDILMPWANIVIKIKIPDIHFQKLLELYEYTMKNKKNFGDQLVGQIDDEPEVTPEILEKFPEWSNFCMQAVENFARTQTEMNLAGDEESLLNFRSEKYLCKMNTMWFVNQKPNEYNPIHIHTNCKVSSVCYLKTPKQQIRDRKEHYKSDGRITFTNNTGTDVNFANHQMSLEPKAGDFYIFPSKQHHAVWPYRSADPDDLRVSLSFNADVTTESALKAQNKNYEKMYEDMKKMKESENDT